MDYNLFKDIEDRYLKWMNYYSLFNGALLVAYCTILVSTGQVIEMGGGISTDNGITGNARLFQLECTYWNILALIAFLGCIASYCWYISAIGHYKWIGRWRETLMQNKNYPELNFNQVKICDITNRAVHYHSTYKVTKVFIVIVLFSWIFVCYSSIAEDNFQLENKKLIIVFIIGCIFLFSELFMHLFVGSNLSIFNKKKNKNCSCQLCNVFGEKLKEIIKIFIFIAIFISIFYCYCNKKEIENSLPTKVKIEMIELKNNSSADSLRIRK